MHAGGRRPQNLDLIDCRTLSCVSPSYKRSTHPVCPLTIGWSIGWKSKRGRRAPGFEAATRPLPVECSRDFGVRKFSGYFFHDWAGSVQKLLSAGPTSGPILLSVDP